MSKLKYCALGDYGIEFVADTKPEVQEWINDQIAESKSSSMGIGPVDEDYYQIVTHTQAELDAMPEN